MTGEAQGLTLKDWLADKHKIIMGKEEEALQFLSYNDCDQYNICMRQKAELVCGLHSEARDCGLLKTLPEGHAAEIEGELNRFSNGARTALELNSPFYMSALLYPDDHKPGEPDNLQKLITKLP